MSTYVDLSLAQVEAELRAAEAYLTTACGRSGHTISGAGDAAQDAHRTRPPRVESDSGLLPRSARARLPIPESRRREILEKLSSERQAAIRATQRGTPPRLCDPPVPAPPLSIEELPRGFGDGEDPMSFHIGSSDVASGVAPQHTASSRSRERGDEDNSDDYGDDDDDDDDGEVFYASDVIGRSIHEPIQPRTALDLFNADDHDHDDEAKADESFCKENDMGERYDHYDDELADTVPTNYRPAQHVSDLEQSHENFESTPASILSRLLSRREDWYNEADIHISQLLSSSPTKNIAATDGNLNDSKVDGVEKVETERPILQRDQAHIETDVYGSNDFLNQEADSSKEGGTYGLSGIPISSGRTGSRIDVLSQPRTRIFADREKQRLLNEMVALKDCTFHPSVQNGMKSTKRTSGDTSSSSHVRTTQTKSVRFDTSSNDAGGVFPWLTLSPRKGSLRIKSKRRSQALIDRLNLDVTVKYEARQRLREMLEAEQMRECTFHPRINPVSRRLLNHTDYKPIHERISEVQREKVEYIQRIREELAYEEGAFTFTPQINARSRQIAEAVLTQKQVSKIRGSARKINIDDEQQLKAMLRPPVVTDRLIQDAEQMAEKRVAVQEYYDALEEKAFVPAISETSNRIVRERPEFKLDFVSRQEYFKMVEQEKLEALEDVVHQEQELTFRPNIGNAEKVLHELRPDLIRESSQQRLDRLIYHEPRLNEIKKQRLREEAYAKHPFKPEINSVSKALAEKAKSDLISKSTHRHELLRYFAGKQFRSRVARELEQAEKAECTFRPQLISRPKVKSSSTSKLQVKERQDSGRSVWRSDTILHTIETQRQQRAEELQAKRNALELKELENCTFQPNTHRAPRRIASVANKREEKQVVVRGLGRFLELKERAKRQDEERKQRAEKVFNPNHAYEPRSYTVPKPFKLSESSKDSIRRRLKLREEMRAKERGECTFAPRTLEAQQRQVLRTLLKD